VRTTSSTLLRRTSILEYREGAPLSALVGTTTDLPKFLNLRFVPSSVLITFAGELLGSCAGTEPEQ